MWTKTNRLMTLAVLTLGFAGGAIAQAATPANPATPSDPPPNKVAVISIRGVIANTNEFRRDFDALAKKFEPKSKEVEGLRKELDTLKADYNAQQDKLDETTKAARLRAIDLKEKSLNRVIEDARAEVDAEQQQLFGRIGEKVMKVVDSYARANHFAAVLDVSTEASNVLWASDQVNISQLVLDKYNTESGVPAPAADAPSATKPVTPGQQPKPTTATQPKRPPSPNTPR
ncbi:MAG: OmpH family outer membrane protein [Acidobacteriales bacterium]|nr:OmpH family outer membrane protein [Terriglobales bacterium]